MRILVFVLFFMLLASASGCGPKAPQGFPKLFPCQITVTKDGKPLSEASVILMPESPSGAYASGGKTNSAGVAIIRTNQGDYTAIGAPEGKHKIILNKPVDIEGKLPDEEVNKMPTHERMQYMAEMVKKANAMTPVIPADLASTQKTPLNITVTSANGKANINIDEYVDQ